MQPRILRCLYDKQFIQESSETQFKEVRREVSKVMPQFEFYPLVFYQAPNEFLYLQGIATIGGYSVTWHPAQGYPLLWETTRIVRLDTGNSDVCVFPERYDSDFYKNEYELKKHIRQCDQRDGNLFYYTFGIQLLVPISQKAFLMTPVAGKLNEIHADMKLTDRINKFALFVVLDSPELESKAVSVTNIIFIGNADFIFLRKRLM